MTGPERRGHEQDRPEPYGRPQAAPTHVPIPAPAPPLAVPGLDAATQAAIQAAAAAAAAAAIAQQQARTHAQLVPPIPVAQQPPSMPGVAQPFVKVSGQSDPRKVAGKLAHTCRESPAPAMLTIGSNCINQAVKAICIARGAQHIAPAAVGRLHWYVCYMQSAYVLACGNRCNHLDVALQHQHSTNSSCCSIDSDCPCAS